MESNTLVNILLFILIIFLILLGAVMSAAETSITSLSIAKIQSLLNKKKFYIRSNIFNWLLNNYNRTLMVILITNTFAITSIATISLTLISNLLKLDIGLETTITTLISTILLLIFCEIIPKIFAKRCPEKYFLFISPLLVFLSWILYPFLWWTKILKNGKNQDLLSENELLELINVISSNGILEVEEKELVKSAITFDDKIAKNSMINKKNVKFLYHDDKWKDLLGFCSKFKYSRIPVVHRITKRISGVIYLKDFLKEMITNINNFPAENSNFHNLIKHPLFFYENSKLDTMLKFMQEKQIHMGIIISNDNRNTFLGIITLEDIIEAIIGKVYDEYDTTGLIKEIGHCRWLVNGSESVKNLFSNHLNISTSKIKNQKWSLLEWFLEEKKISINSIAYPKNRILKFNKYYFQLNYFNNNNFMFSIYIK